MRVGYIYIRAAYSLLPAVPRVVRTRREAFAEPMPVKEKKEKKNNFAYT